MTPYATTLKVAKADLDDLNHVNNIRYVQWIQDISKEHWEKIAPPGLREGLIWVVMNHNIDYKAAAKLDDIVELSTYIAENYGAKCTRIVEIRSIETKTLFVRSKTVWCLLDRATYRPKRISKKIEELFLSDAP